MLTPTLSLKPLVNLSLAAVALLCSGCGGMESNVEGLVTLDGKPLEHGSVAFHSTEGGATAFGTIQSDGSYQLKTGATEGLRAGAYKVTVLSQEIPPETKDRRKGPPLPGRPITPIRYSSANTTDLTKEIQSGYNKIDLELVNGGTP